MIITADFFGVSRILLFLYTVSEKSRFMVQILGFNFKNYENLPQFFFSVSGTCGRDVRNVEAQFDVDPLFRITCSKFDAVCGTLQCVSTHTSNLNNIPCLKLRFQERSHCGDRRNFGGEYFISRFNCLCNIILFFSPAFKSIAPAPACKQSKRSVHTGPTI